MLSYDKNPINVQFVAEFTGYVYTVCCMIILVLLWRPHKQMKYSSVWIDITDSLGKSMVFPKWLYLTFTSLLLNVKVQAVVMFSITSCSYPLSTLFFSMCTSFFFFFSFMIAGYCYLNYLSLYR